LFCKKGAFVRPGENAGSARDAARRDAGDYSLNSLRFPKWVRFAVSAEWWPVINPVLQREACASPTD